MEVAYDKAFGSRPEHESADVLKGMAWGCRHSCRGRTSRKCC